MDDIKFAGAVSDIVRWGWPYHGLVTGGAIGSTGKTITQPSSGVAFLVDMGLPAIELTPDEITKYAALSWDWRNYALLPQGSVNGHNLPNNNSFVHVDAANVPWLVKLQSQSFPSDNTARLNFTIVRFGLFRKDLGPQTPISKTVDIACESLIGDGIYTDRYAALHDVWTNGSKALYCVELAYAYSIGGTPGSISRVFSCIEVMLTGTGGADGSGLDLAAAEIKGSSALSLQDANSPGVDLIVAASGALGANRVITDVGVCVPGSPDDNLKQTAELVVSDGTFFTPYGTVVRNGQDNTFTVCRKCFYDAAGVATALRVRSSQKIDSEIVTVPTTTGGLDHNYCVSGWVYGAVATWQIGWKTTRTTGVYLLHNDTVIDKFERVVVEQRMQTKDYISPTVFYSNYDFPEVVTVTGTLTDKLMAAGKTYSDLVFLIETPIFWYTPDSTPNISEFEDVQTDTSKTVGIYRFDHTAAFYYADAGGRIYADVATPAGIVTTSETGRYNYAWQRKTGEYTFDSAPICYI